MLERQGMSNLAELQAGFLSLWSIQGTTEPFASNAEAISDWGSVLRQMDELSCTYYELLFAGTPPCSEARQS
jgi:hypothetical protein